MINQLTATTTKSFCYERLRTTAMWLACLSALIVPVVASAGNIRIWPAAVVTEADVRLGDVCELSGFDAEQAAKLESIVVTTSPATLGSKLIRLNFIRTVLQDHSINLAEIKLGGAVECSVTRPSAAISQQKPVNQGLRASGKPNVNGKPDLSKSLTLADAVTAFFQRELRHYNGVVEVTFGRISKQVLSLTEPEFQFVVRKRSGPPLGLISLTVDVIKAEQIEQTIPMAVQVQLRERMLIARKAVNQGATIGEDDVELVTTTVTRIDRTLIRDRDAVIGQRAKRFIALGVPIQQTMIESVPLVRRGQLVTLTSVDNNISIVTTAKAAEDGRLGDVIRVTATGSRKVFFHGVVVGVGHVQMSGQVAASSNAAVALGGRP